MSRPSFGRKFEEVLCERDGKSVAIWECLYVHNKLKSFLSIYVDDINIIGKKQNMDSMWTILQKEIGLEDPALFIDQVH